MVPETNQYRRAAVVHTCIGESFLEIGCDFGPCVDRVRKALTEMSAVPMDPAAEIPTDQIKTTPTKNGSSETIDRKEAGRVVCLGIDKSPESIKVAIDR